jgi:hypothetical protein
VILKKLGVSLAKEPRLTVTRLGLTRVWSDLGRPRPIRRRASRARAWDGGARRRAAVESPALAGKGVPGLGFTRGKAPTCS